MEIWNSKTWCKEEVFGKTKGYSIQLTLSPKWTEYFYILFKWNRNCDHAGLTLNLEVLWFMFNFTIYDVRHWDDENNKWVEYRIEV